MAAVPAWVWLPGQDTPIEAGELDLEGGASRFRYRAGYLARGDAVPLDPVELRLVRAKRGIAITAADGLPGVVRDAMPTGYGADRLRAQAGRELGPLDRLEHGVPDGVGAIEVCHDIGRKLRWRPRELAELRALTEQLAGDAPSSRALRRFDDGFDTSAGGERPKVTLVHRGGLWLAKMQDRGDRPAMPAREFVAMRLAAMAGLEAATVELHTFGDHQVLLVERFDRSGDPFRPRRRLYASAHTALRLAPATVRGDPQRSYLNLGDRLRIWAKGRADLAEQLAELWRRMSFNALVGNVDDHPLNHGFLRCESPERGGWGLAPAFDITPAPAGKPQTVSAPPTLALATGADGAGLASAERLLAAARHFSLDPSASERWLATAARLVADEWEPLLRAVAAPIGPTAAWLDAVVGDTRASFAYAEALASRV